MSSNKSVAETLQPFVCAGASGVTAAVIIHPIDLIKVHLQLSGQKNPMARPSFMGVARNVVAAEGVPGLWAGVGAAVGRQMIYGTSRMGMYRALADRVSEQRKRDGLGPIPSYMRFGISASTGALGAILGCPMDVAMVRMQSDTTAVGAEKRGYKNVFDALIRVVQEEGALTLWRGSLPLVARGAAMNLGQMASYDMAKDQIINIRGTGTITNLMSSAVSGFFAAFCSLPFDMMKSRMMNMAPDPTTGQMPYKSLADCFMKVLTREGPLRFWYGFGTYYLRCAPTAMIQLMAIEQYTKLYKANFLTPKTV